MMDGKMCSRRHRHVDHYVSLEYERLLVMKDVLKLKNNEDLYVAIPERIRKLGPLVTSANTVVVTTEYVRDFEAARKAALYRVQAYDGDAFCSQKRTKFWDGKAWSKSFYIHHDSATEQSTQVRKLKLYIAVLQLSMSGVVALC